MILSFCQLKKRDVINVADGRCFGKIVDLSIEFPKGTLTGITVPARKKKWFLRLFDKNTLFIPERNILKIGGDAILVDLKYGGTGETHVDVNRPQPSEKPKPPCSPCVPCSPCASPCPPKKERNDAFDRIDLDDY